MNRTMNDPTDFDGTASSMVTPTLVRHRNEER
jgi:hypothetical protein